MNILSREEIESSDEGRHFFPDDILARIHPEILKDASATYAKLVADHPDYNIGMVRDAVMGGVIIYWKRIV